MRQIGSRLSGKSSGTVFKLSRLTGKGLRPVFKLSGWTGKDSGTVFLLFRVYLESLGPVFLLSRVCPASLGSIFLLSRVYPESLGRSFLRSRMRLEARETDPAASGPGGGARRAMLFSGRIYPRAGVRPVDPRNASGFRFVGADHLHLAQLGPGIVDVQLSLQRQKLAPPAPLAFGLWLRCTHHEDSGTGHRPHTAAPRSRPVSALMFMVRHR